MAQLGVLARLTQQASDNRVAEQDFRSSLFARGRQEILQGRQQRLAEGQAIVGLIERSGARKDKKKREAEQDALVREGIKSREKIAGIRASAGGGAFGPIVPPLPAIGGNFDPATLGVGLLPGTGTAPAINGTTAAIKIDPFVFNPTSAADDQTVRNARTSLSKAASDINITIDRLKNAQAKQARSVKQSDPVKMEAATLRDRAAMDIVLISKGKILADLKDWNDVVLFEDRVKPDFASATDLKNLERAQQQEISFKNALDTLQSRVAAGSLNKSIRPEGQNNLFDEEQLKIGISSAQAIQDLMNIKIDSRTPFRTKPQAIPGGSKGLERAAEAGNLNAKKVNEILIGN